MCHGGRRKDKTISEEEKERGDRAERVEGGGEKEKRGEGLLLLHPS